MMTIQEAIRRLGECGFHFGESALDLRVENPAGQMREIMARLVSEPAWLPEYDEIADWLADNRRRGLLLIGAPGLGKTLMAARVIPVIVLRASGKIMTYVSARDINLREREIMTQRLLVIDDAGVEDTKNDFGERRDVFSDIVDRAEQRGGILVITTNLTPAELERKYQTRTVDRLRAITRWVVLTGTSFRK